MQKIKDRLSGKLQEEIKNEMRRKNKEIGNGLSAESGAGTKKYKPAVKKSMRAFIAMCQQLLKK